MIEDNKEFEEFEEEEEEEDYPIGEKPYLYRVPFEVSVNGVKKDIGLCHPDHSHIFETFKWCVKKTKNNTVIKTTIPKSILKPEKNKHLSPEIIERLKPFIGKSIQGHIFMRLIALGYKYKDRRKYVMFPKNRNWLDLNYSNWKIKTKAIYQNDIIKDNNKEKNNNNKPYVFDSGQLFVQKNNTITEDHHHHHQKQITPITAAATIDSKDEMPYTKPIAALPYMSVQEEEEYDKKNEIYFDTLNVLKEGVFRLKFAHVGFADKNKKSIYIMLKTATNICVSRYFSLDKKQDIHSFEEFLKHLKIDKLLNYKETNMSIKRIIDKITLKKKDINNNHEYADFYLTKKPKTKYFIPYVFSHTNTNTDSIKYDDKQENFNSNKEYVNSLIMENIKVFKN